MRTIFAKDFKSGWKQFSGGEWATVVTPENGGTAHPIRPDGSLCEPRGLRLKERKTLESLNIMKTAEDWNWEHTKICANDPAVHGQLLPAPQMVKFGSGLL